MQGFTGNRGRIAAERTHGRKKRLTAQGRYDIMKLSNESEVTGMMITADKNDTVSLTFAES